MAERSILIPAGSATAVAGLSWTKLGKDPKLELKSNSKMLGSKHGLLIETPRGVQLLGLVSVTAPSRARSAISAAAWLANASEVRVLFIKALPNGEFWVLCAGAGELDQRTDEIVHEEVAVQIIDMVLSDASHDDNGKIRIVVDGDRYPNSNMIDRFDRENATFAELVRGYTPTKAERVRKIVGITGGQLLAIILIIAAIAVAVYAYELYEQHLRDEEIARQQAELQRQHLTAEQIKTETDLRITRAVIQAVAEDTATPPPDALLKACVATLRRVGDEIAGWRLGQAQCAPTGTNVDFSFNLLDGVAATGTNASIIETAKKRFGVTPSVAIENAHASLSINVPPPDARPALTPPQLPRYGDIVEKFGTRFQLLHQEFENVHVTMGTPGARPITYLDPARENSQDPNRFAQVPVDRGYRRGTVQITGTSLWQIEQFSLAYPFFTIKKIEVTPSGSDPDAYQWSIEGEYVASRS